MLFRVDSLLQGLFVKAENLREKKGKVKSLGQISVQIWRPPEVTVPCMLGCGTKNRKKSVS